MLIVGNNNANTLNGTNANDVILGRGGDDKVFAKAGDDTVYGQAGNDKLAGGSGDDAMYGNAGDDVLNGEAGDDSLYGGGGRDILRGSFGDDTLYGGGGNDTFGFELNFSTAAQTDTIEDFGGNDKIQLGGFKNALYDHLDDNDDGVLDIDDDNVFDDGNGLELDFSGYFGRSIYLNVEQVNELTFSDFIV